MAHAEGRRAPAAEPGTAARAPARVAARAALAAALVVLPACARPPARLAGEFPGITPVEVQSAARVGDRIRWGGEIVSTRPREGETCFEVVGKPLDRRARPRLVDETTGRFIACAAGFYDPAVWAPGREMTAVGTVEELSEGRVGESRYVFPRVRAETVHLWPEREPPPMVYDPWPGPYWWYPYPGPFWHPYPYWYWYGYGHGHVRRPVPPRHPGRPGRRR